MSTYDLHPQLFLTNGVIKTTGTSANLTAGDLGLYDPFTNQVVTVANAATHPLAYIAQGSFYASDKIGVHGGYKASIKSPAFTRGINPKHVRRFYKTAPVAATNQSIRMFWDGGAASAGPQFLCGKTYFLRLEAKGEPVLRMINRNIYKHLPAYTGCCGNDCTAPCTPEVVDAAAVMYQWANGVNNDPLLSKFMVARAILKTASTTLSVTATSTAATATSGTGIVVGQRIIAVGVPYGTTVAAVAGTAVTLSIAATATGTPTATFNTVVDGTYVSPATSILKAAVVAGIEVDVTYVDTIFADCSFNQSDYYNDKFVEVLGSLVYQNGDVCDQGEVIMSASTGIGFYEIIPFAIPRGSGELILREFIASQLQLGIFFSHVPRDRETTGNIALTAVDRSATYTKYCLIYSVDTVGNPSNALSKDQYILHFAMKTGVSATAFETLFLTWLQAFNPTLALETIV